jgi:HPt (histidine-containing phosphotransfer) domain-containing protein
VPIGAWSKTKDYLEVSQVAHFLKGSSAALGVQRVTNLFERIQLTANDIYKAIKFVFLAPPIPLHSLFFSPLLLLSNRASRVEAAKAAAPSFDEASSSLTDPQKETVAAAEKKAMEENATDVRSVQRWFDKVEVEYEVAEKWLRGEYEGGDESDE